MNVATAVVMMFYPKEAYSYVLIFMATGFILSGISTLVYYFTMARYMVGGKLSLYKAVVLIDFGFLTQSLADVPRFYVIIYLAVIHMFSGFVEILRSREAIQSGARQWKLKLTHGLVNILVSVVCLAMARKTNTAVYMYCLGIIYSGIIRIVTTFRRTELLYVR